MTATEVLIAGGGPVGMGLALELGSRRIRSVVVERHRSPQPIPKGQNLTQRTMEHFRTWGVETAIRRARVMPADYPAAGRTAYGSLLSGYHYPWYRRADVGPYYHVTNERLPQYRTEAVLRAAVAELPSIEVRLGSTVRSVEQHRDGASVVATSETGEEETIEAGYLVGCDGSRSLIADQIGIDKTRSDHDRVMALIVFRSPGLNRLLESLPPTSFFNVLHPDFDGYWQFLGRVDADDQWFFHAPVVGVTSSSEVDVAATLHRAVGAEFEFTVDHVGLWDLHIATATNYRSGRTFLAGDAAHSHPPYGGFGINTGLEDARNLGWKLAAVVAGWGGDHLLDSYDLERRPVFESTARDFIEAFIEADRRLVRSFDPAVDRAAFEQAWGRRASASDEAVRTFAPHYEGSPLVDGLPGAVSSAGGAHGFPARAGHHLAPQPLSSGRPMVDELGPDFTLLAFDAEGDTVAGFVAAGAELGVPLHVISDRARAGRESYQAPLILVRPDHFVAWAGGGDDVDARSPLRILGRAVGR